MDVAHLRVAQTLTDHGPVIEARIDSLGVLRDSLFSSTRERQRFAAIETDEGHAIYVAVVSITAVHRLTKPNDAALPVAYTEGPDYAIKGWTLVWDVTESVPQVVPLEMYAEMDPVGTGGTLRIRRTATSGEPA